jgi:hypothetical protein
MASKGYTSRTEIENYLVIDIDASFHDQVDRWICDIEKYIDQQTGRNFVADSVASARYFDGDNSRTLLIDDAVAITEIKTTDTVMVADTDPLLADGDFILYPANKLPITKIALRASVFPAYPLRGIKITGKWGYSVAVPEDIKHAATVLVAGIINYSWTAEGEVKTMSIGRYSVTYHDKTQWMDYEKVDAVLDLYKKYSF